MKKNKKIFAFDIDNTICKTKGSIYSKSIPKKNVIKLINKLKRNGHEIKIFTSRYMGRNKDNSNLVKKKYYNLVKKYLKKWGLEYDKLILGKPSYDYFIDDKTINPRNNNLNRLFKKYINVN